MIRLFDIIAATALVAGTIGLTLTGGGLIAIPLTIAILGALLALHRQKADDHSDL